MRQHLGNDLAGEDLSDIAAFGEGASGADVTEWVKVARSVARQAGRTIELDDLLAQVAPTENRPPEIDQRIAVHEAGHAVVMQVLGPLEVSSVSTISSGVTGGSVTIAAPSRMLSKADMDSYVTFVLAGRSGEEIVLGSVSSGSGGSRHSYLAMATQMVASAHLSLGMGGSLLYPGEPEDFRNLLSLDFHVVPKIEADLQRLYANATDIVVEYREAVKAVTKALLRERFLSGVVGTRLGIPPDGLRDLERAGYLRRVKGVPSEIAAPDIYYSRRTDRRYLRHHQRRPRLAPQARRVHPLERSHADVPRWPPAMARSARRNLGRPDRGRVPQAGVQVATGRDLRQGHGKPARERAPENEQPRFP